MDHVLRWLEEDGIGWSNPRTPPAAVYVRFGKWGRRHRSINFHTGDTEKGMSVYPAKLTADGHVALADDDRLRLTPDDCAEVLNGRLAFVVTGKEVGMGSDGEPLLVGVKLLPYSICPDSIPPDIRRNSPTV